VNHFERLIRRAMLRPAVRPGAAVVDPFERTDAWPLDTPAEIASTPPVAEPVSPVARPALPSPLAVAAPDPRLVPINESTPAAPITEQILSAEPVAIVPPQEPIAHPIDRTPVVAPPALTAVERDAAALAHADAFLRTLGVQVPASPAPDLIPALPPPPGEIAARARPVPDVSRGPQQISPPAPPPDPPSAPPPPPRMDPVETVNQPRDGTTDPAPRAHPPVVTREILLVDRSVARRAPGAPGTAGVGSPHIGLGQL